MTENSFTSPVKFAFKIKYTPIPSTVDSSKNLPQETIVVVSEDINKALRISEKYIEDSFEFYNIDLIECVSQNQIIIQK